MEQQVSPCISGRSIRRRVVRRRAISSVAAYEVPDRPCTVCAEETLFILTSPLESR